MTKLQLYIVNIDFFQGSDSNDCINEDTPDPEATTPKEIASDKVRMVVKYTVDSSLFVEYQF